MDGQDRNGYHLGNAMSKTNKAIQGLCFRSSVPAVCGDWGFDGWGWKQLHENPKSAESVLASSVCEAGQIVLEHMTPCIPLRLINEVKEFFEGSLSNEGIHLVEEGDEAFVDFGRLGDERSYNPLDDVSLWKRFLETGDYRLKAHKLYCRYGFLFSRDRDEVTWITSAMSRSLESRQGEWEEFTRKAYAYSEPLERWYVEFDRLELAKDIWNISSNEEYDLRKKETYLGNRIEKFYNECRCSFWVNFKDYLDLIRWEGDIEKNLHRSETSTQELIRNAKYEHQIFLLSSLMSHGIGRVKSSISIDNHSNFKQSLVPSCLASAVWLQFAEYIADGSKILVCEGCKQPFIRLRQQHRDKTYCSTACKQKAWRNSPEQRTKRKQRTQP